MTFGAYGDQHGESPIRVSLDRRMLGEMLAALAFSGQKGLIALFVCTGAPDPYESIDTSSLPRPPFARDGEIPQDVPSLAPQGSLRAAPSDMYLRRRAFP